ncbi:MAG: hypothetical protein AAF141_00785 [Pseudomonadota bacterium]
MIPKSFRGLATTALLTGSVSMMAVAPTGAGQTDQAAIGRAKQAYDDAKALWQKDRDQVLAGIREVQKLEAERDRLEKEAHAAWVGANREIDEAEQERAAQTAADEEALASLEARYQALDKQYNALATEHANLLNTYASGKTSRVEGRRAARVLDELRDLSDQKIKIGYERADLILAASDRSRESGNRIYNLKQSRPSQFEVNRIRREFSATLEDQADIPSAYDLENDEDRVHEAGMRYLSALLAAPPNHVEAVEATLNGRVVYSANWTQDANQRRGVSDDERAALDAKIAELTKHRDIIQKELAPFLQDKARLREALEEAHGDYAYHTETIFENEINLLYFNFAVEASAVVVGAVLSGGVAVPVMYGAGELVGKSVKPAARKVAADTTAIMSDVFLRLAKKANGTPLQKTTRAAAELIGRIPEEARDDVISSLTDAGFKVGEFGLAKKAGSTVGGDVDPLNALGLRRWKEVVLSDSIELAVTDGANIAAVIGAGKLVPRVTFSEAAQSVGLALAATALKAGATEVTDRTRDSHIYGYREAQIRFALAREAFIKASAVARGLEHAKAQLTQKIEALEVLRDNGRGPRQLGISVNETLDAEEVETVGTFDIRIQFSNELDSPPSISAPGVTFAEPEKSFEDGRVWNVEIAYVADADRRASIPLTISLSDGEAPFSHLDSQPRTTARLASLGIEGWVNFEKGADQNHTLRLKPAAEDEETTPEDTPPVDMADIAGLWRFEDGVTWRIETQGGFDIVKPTAVKAIDLRKEIEALSEEIDGQTQAHRVYVWRSFEDPTDVLEHTRIRNVDREVYEFVGEDVSAEFKPKIEAMKSQLASKRATLAAALEKKTTDQVAYDDLRYGAGIPVRITVRDGDCVFLIDTAYFDGKTLGYDTTLDRLCRFNEELPANVKSELMSGRYPRNLMGMLTLKHPDDGSPTVLDGEFWTRYVHHSSASITRVTELTKTNPRQAVRVPASEQNAVD